MIEKKEGHYLGTVIDNHWWKRYKGENYHMRGTGEYWYDEEHFYFLRKLTRKPIVIPFNAVEEITLGSWHAGKWTARPLLKLFWSHEGKNLSSGFAVSKKKDEVVALKKLLEEKVAS